MTKTPKFDETENLDEGDLPKPSREEFLVRAEKVERALEVYGQ